MAPQSKTFGTEKIRFRSPINFLEQQLTVLALSSTFICSFFFFKAYINVSHNNWLKTFQDCWTLTYNQNPPTDNNNCKLAPENRKKSSILQPRLKQFCQFSTAGAHKSKCFTRQRERGIGIPKKVQAKMFKHYLLATPDWEDREQDDALLCS